MTNKKIVIGIAGGIGSGKGTVTKYLKDRYGVKQMRYSKILADVLGRLYLDYDRENLNTIAEGLRSMFGKDILSKVLEKDIRSTEAEIIVFDGIRKEEELNYFKNKTENFFFVFVDTPLEVVAKRIVGRGEKTDDHEQTVESLKKRQEQPSDKDVPGLKVLADFVVDNSGNLENAYLQVDEMIKEIKN